MNILLDLFQIYVRKNIYTILIISTISVYLYLLKQHFSGKFLSYRSPSDIVAVIFFVGNLLSRGTRIWIDWLAGHNFTTLGIYRRRRMLKYSWNKRRRPAPSLLLAPSSSSPSRWSLLSTLCYTRTSSLTSSSSTSSRTPGLTRKSTPKIASDRSF